MGYIEEISRKNDKGKYKIVDNYIPLPLIWAYEDRTITFIKPKQKKLLDIGHIVKAFLNNKGKHNFIFCFPVKPFGEITELAQGEYKILIDKSPNSISLHNIPEIIG